MCGDDLGIALGRRFEPVERKSFDQAIVDAEHLDPDAAIRLAVPAGDALAAGQIGVDDDRLANGKVDGNAISFTVTFDFGGMPFLLSYKGVVSSSQIKMSGDAAGMPFEFVLSKGK